MRRAISRKVLGVAGLGLEAELLEGADHRRLVQRHHREHQLEEAEPEALGQLLREAEVEQRSARARACTIRLPGCGSAWKKPCGQDHPHVDAHQVLHHVGRVEAGGLERRLVGDLDAATRSITSTRRVDQLAVDASARPRGRRRRTCARTRSALSASRRKSSSKPMCVVQLARSGSSSSGCGSTHS